MPYPNRVQQQVWDEADDDDDFDDYHERHGRKKRGGGCLIGVVVALVLVIVVFVLGWFVFPEKKDELLSRVGLAPTATVTPTIEPTAEPEMDAARRLDVNGSGRVDICDAQMIYDAMMQGDASDISEEMRMIADVNGDGAVDHQDILCVLNYIRNQ